ncbi:substrate-binding domain-containing protein [Streptacidiphilus carbonis]|uniref:substrate-binding domain-containing protein n=1 Tax=Streptacidiphilus carbonis TaxID=105422 RepID=UPI0005A99176|nr:substrate-binding domain-containing protein [Streptacidiphilus carbonis]
MRPSVDERQERILRLVRERGSLRVAELAAELGVSAVTTRRDVETLAELGRLHRVHGAVTWPERTAPAVAPAAVRHPVEAAGPVLGLLVPAVQYYYAEVIHGARAAAAAAGARLVLGISKYRQEEDAAQIASMLAAGADGLLLTPNWVGSTPTAAEEQTILGLQVPTVLLERRAAPGSAAAELDRVCTDHVHGACAAVRHLAGLGRRRIALLATDATPTAGFVRTGYLGGLEALGLDQPEGLAAADIESQLRQLPDLVAAGAVDAVLVHTDTEALILLQHLQARGLRVPEDVALVAYDDEMAALADVPLTAVAPPKHALGEAAVGMLLDRLAEEPGSDSPRRHLDLLPQLRVRQSTATAGATAVS